LRHLDKLPNIRRCDWHKIPITEALLNGPVVIERIDPPYRCDLFRAQLVEVVIMQPENVEHIYTIDREISF